MKDIIVIGAGFTGLCAGALLSKGLDVLVVEKNSYLGGRAGTRTPKEWGWADVENYNVDFGHHVFATDNYLEYVIRSTGAGRYAKPVKLNLPLFYKGGQFHSLPKGLIGHLKAFPFLSLSSKMRIKKFMDHVKKLSYQEVMDTWIYRLVDDVYDEFDFDHDARELFTDGFVAGYQTTTETSKLSGGDLIFCMKAYLKGMKKHGTPIFAAQGGVGRLAEALGKVIRENGGEILTGTEVKRISVEDGVAKGVVLDDGREIRCRKVLYSAPVYGLLDLVTELDDDHRSRLRDAKKDATDLFMVMGGVKRPLMEEPAGTWIMVPESEVSNVDSYYLVYEVDERLKQAPPGEYYVSFAAEVDPAHLSSERDLISKFKSDMQDIFTSVDLDRDLTWLGGEYFPIVDGLVRTVDWYHERRFGPETPIEGLYVAGDSAHELSSGVDGCASSAVFAVEAITGKTLLDMERFYRS